MALLINRQDQKKPTKKLVQPTLVSPPTDERKDLQEGVGTDNPVATAAAIAAAAASAATGPFLQVFINQMLGYVLVRKSKYNINDCF